MRRIILSLAAATVIGVGLAAAAPANAHDGRSSYGSASYGYDGWRDRQWRGWEWRRHLRREWRERHGGYWQPNGHWYR